MTPAPSPAGGLAAQAPRRPASTTTSAETDRRPPPGGRNGRHPEHDQAQRGPRPRGPHPVAGVTASPPRSWRPERPQPGIRPSAARTTPSTLAAPA